jgi:hypothetical protein
MKFMFRSYIFRHQIHSVCDSLLSFRNNGKMASVNVFSPSCRINSSQSSGQRHFQALVCSINIIKWLAGGRRSTWKNAWPNVTLLTIYPTWTYLKASNNFVLNIHVDFNMSISECKFVMSPRIVIYQNNRPKYFARLPCFYFPFY